MDQLAAKRDLSPDVIEAILVQHRDRLKHLEGPSGGDYGHKSHGELHDGVERLLISPERTRINELFRSGKLKDEARRRIERELDCAKLIFPINDHRCEARTAFGEVRLPPFSGRIMLRLVTSAECQKQIWAPMAECAKSRFF